MQRAVERDSLSRSNYGMCAVNPSRIGKSFTETALREVVDTISRRAEVLLEIVNYSKSFPPSILAGISLTVDFKTSRASNTSLLEILLRSTPSPTCSTL
jgi:hypothetical protein